MICVRRFWVLDTIDSAYVLGLVKAMNVKDVATIVPSKAASEKFVQPVWDLLIEDPDVPSHSTARMTYGLSSALSRQGNFERAESVVNRCLSKFEISGEAKQAIEPSHFDFHMTLGQIALNRRDWEEAEKVYRRLVSSKLDRTTLTLQELLECFREDPNGKNILWALKDLAVTLSRLWRMEEAERLGRISFASFEEVYGSGHPNTVTRVHK